MSQTIALPARFFNPEVAAAIAQERQRRTVKHWDEENARCADDIEYWMRKWVYTYDPRLLSKRQNPFVQFIPWPKQIDFLHWLDARYEGNEEGLCEKSRDTGVTYLCCAWSVHKWLYMPGFKATFGSRKLDLVDKKDNPDAIFHKMRIILYHLPKEMLPKAFNSKVDDKYCSIGNPSNGAIITGEGGDEMGRGGRTTVYFVDEGAFVPNADNVEAALSGNTDTTIWVSSVNGMGNLFARKRHSILKPHQIFRLHWTDDPRKSPEWAKAKKASFSDVTKWASEYDIDYTASVEGICIPAKWVEAAKRVRALVPGLRASNGGVAGLDVGGGKAKSVFVPRKGQLILSPRSRGNPDTVGTAHWALDAAKELGIDHLNYDSVGVGLGVTSAFLNTELPISVAGINTGTNPTEMIWEDGQKSNEMFANLKAELWWRTRAAFKKTYEHVCFLEGDLEEGHRHNEDELIALEPGPETDTMAQQLSLVKVFKTLAGKLRIERKDELERRGIPSPDYADACVLSFIDGTEVYDKTLNWV